MKIEAHKKLIKESLEVIREAINNGYADRQRTLGFHCSAVLMDMLEIYLHSKNLIDPGASIKHDLFGSEKKADERLPHSFDHRTQIIKILIEIEKRRNLLCYGKGHDERFIEEYLELFNKAKRIFDSMGVEYE